MIFVFLGVERFPKEREGDGSTPLTNSHTSTRSGVSFENFGGRLQFDGGPSYWKSESIYTHDISTELIWIHDRTPLELIREMGYWEDEFLSLPFL